MRRLFDSLLTVLAVLALALPTLAFSHHRAPVIERAAVVAQAAHLDSTPITLSVTHAQVIASFALDSMPRRSTMTPDSSLSLPMRRTADYLYAMHRPPGRLTSADLLKYRRQRS